MGEAILVQRYGTASDAQFAAMLVTYPEGSTCTCTDGNVTFSDSNTDGQILFNVPDSGPWTISCTDGAKVKDKEVSVAEGEIKKLALHYPLYTAGDDGSNWIEGIGGSSYGGYGDITWNTDNVHIRGNYHSTSGAVYYTGISTPVKLSSNTIRVTVSSLTGKYAYLLLSNIPLGSSSSSTFQDCYKFASLQLSQGENVLDVSNLTDEVYLIIYAYGYDEKACDCYITNISID